MRKIQTLVALCLLSSMAMADCDTNISATTPDENFDESGGIVLDKQTGLMWKQCPEGLSEDGCAVGVPDAVTWAQALEAVDALNTGGGFAGHTDWRLPNIKELQSIVEEQCDSPARNETVFPGDYRNQLWSSSPVAVTGDDTANRAWFIAVGDGVTSNEIRSRGLGIRLVRGG